MDDGDLAAQADATWGALAAWSGRHDPPRVIVKDGVLARATERALEPYDRFSLREEASRAAKFYRTSRQGVPTMTYPPAEVMDALLRRDPAEYKGVPRVGSVVDVPVVAEDSSIVVRAGIHPSGLFYRPAPGLGDVFVEEVASADEVEWARDLLLEDLLGDFEFADQASRANALALTLLPFVRHLIGDDPTPLHAVLAPQQGSGKTYLVQACLIPGCGVVGLATEPRNEEELRKLITSSLLRSRPALVFDNVGGQVVFGTLASALTSRVWQDRILGQSKEVDLPIRCVWATTGNNWQGSADLVDRVCPIELVPRDGVPARHRPANHFRHPDLHGWASGQRPALVSACLTLVRHWLEGAARMMPDGTFERHEHRQASDETLGSFGRWADVVGGVLAAADVPGFLGNLEDLRARMDPDSQEIADFVLTWRERLGDAWLTSDELASACAPGGALSASLPAAVDDRNVRKSLRYWLRSHRGQTHAGLTVRGSGSRPLRWSVRGRGERTCP